MIQLIKCETPTCTNAIHVFGREDENTILSSQGWVNVEGKRFCRACAPAVLISGIEGVFSIAEHVESEKPLSGNVSFNHFSHLNLMRSESEDGFDHHLNSWSLTEWLMATFGELGEAANYAKKIIRHEQGIRGNKESIEELRVGLRRELADAFIYLDLTCQRAGFRLGPAVAEVFERKSAEIGYLQKPQTWRKDASDPTYENLVSAAIVAVIMIKDEIGELPDPGEASAFDLKKAKTVLVHLKRAAEELQTSEEKNDERHA